MLLDSRRNRARGKEREERNEKKRGPDFPFLVAILTEKKRRVLPTATTMYATVLETGHTGVCCVSVSQSFTERGHVQCRSETPFENHLLLRHQSDFVCLVSECNSRARVWCVCVL